MSTKKYSESKQTKSCIADHDANENHLVNWEESSIWCAADNHNDLCHTFAKGVLDSNFN